MADIYSSALLEIHDALRQRAFERQPSAGEHNFYKGLLDPTGLKIPAFLFVDDLDFVDLPIIGIDPDYPVMDRRLPHVLSESRSICYYAKGSVVLDRYNPAGTVVQCLEQAERVLRAAVKGESNADFAAEFGAYWTSSWLLVDLPPEYAGAATIEYVDLSGNGTDLPVLSQGGSWLLKRDRTKTRRAKEPEPAMVVTTNRHLTLDPNNAWPPKTLGELNTWLSWVAPELVGALERSMGNGTRAVGCLAIRAPNGVFACRVEVPHRLRTEEFLRNRRGSLPNFMSRFANEVDVERISGVSATLDHIFDRNLGSRRNLSGKKILLIGCGTIGSFLAQQLAQSGAGLGSGSLTLIDGDILQPSNLGRHLLGVPFLRRNKAEACATFLLEQLPGLTIEAHAGDFNAFTRSLTRFDLVIDATGEEAFSLALNQQGVDGRPKMPPHIFVWLLGNGAIAQCILTGEADKACFKCLKPELAGTPAFPCTPSGGSARDRAEPSVRRCGVCTLSCVTICCCSGNGLRSGSRLVQRGSWASISEPDLRP